MRTVSVAVIVGHWTDDVCLRQLAPSVEWNFPKPC